MLLLCDVEIKRGIVIEVRRINSQHNNGTLT